MSSLGRSTSLKGILYSPSTLITKGSLQRGDHFSWLPKLLCSVESAAAAGGEGHAVCNLGLSREGTQLQVTLLGGSGGNRLLSRCVCVRQGEKEKGMCVQSLIASWIIKSDFFVLTCCCIILTRHIFLRGESLCVLSGKCLIWRRFKKWVNSQPSYWDEKASSADWWNVWEKLTYQAHYSMPTH